MCGGEEGALGVGKIKIHYVYVYSCHQLHKSLFSKKEKANERKQLEHLLIFCCLQANLMEASS